MKRGRKRKLRSRKTKNPFDRKPWKRCAVCLFQIGFTALSISKKLPISPQSIGVLIFRASIKRKPLKRIRQHFQKENTINRLIVADYRRQRPLLKLLDETRHWWNHPTRIVWSSLKLYHKNSKVHLAKRLVGFKCKFCGCDASAIPEKRRKAAFKYCSAKCQIKARIAAHSIRLQSDPEFWLQRSKIRKRCYYRTRQERPEVIKAQVRRMLANPINRIIRNHRMYVRKLVKGDFMIKTQPSKNYLGCTPEFLKAHLESQFKPGMTWDNHGKAWHVDHKFPLKPPKPFALNLKDPNECARVFNWRNLRPMFGKENMSKSNKVIEELVPLSLVTG